MKNIWCNLIFFCLATCGLTLQAAALPTDLSRVGQAKLEVLWFDIYKAYLYCRDGAYRTDSPCLLKVNYLRNISADDLLEETDKQWQGKVEPEQKQTWLKQLETMWPDIQKGDSLSFYRDEIGVGHFYFNNKHIGSIESDVFSQRFLDIWLADSSDYPELAKKLRGER